LQVSGVSAVLSGYACYQVRHESYPAPAQTYVIAERHRDLLESVEWNYNCFLRKGRQTFLQTYPGYRGRR